MISEQDRHDKIMDSMYTYIEDNLEDFLKESIRSSLYLHELNEWSDREEEYMDDAVDILLVILKKDLQRIGT
jgi:hypothetical protein